MPETLWDFLPQDSLAPPGSPGLMGALRSKVYLPRGMNFGKTQESAYRCFIVNQLTNPPSRTPVDSLAWANNWIRRQVTYRQSNPWRAEIECTWGAPPPSVWFFRYTRGPYAGAYEIQSDGQRVCAFNPSEAANHVMNSADSNPIEMVQE